MRLEVVVVCATEHEKLLAPDEPGELEDEPFDLEASLRRRRVRHTESLARSGQFVGTGLRLLGVRVSAL